ncbi:hypothetical protein EDB81DRAFT_878759 [Dactylonectria macrodidyma]|uniref:Uncharacterized protein n=1 Tax=Dactylonectria macrodidyma TaxID=307937 RepID=A0A9P9FPP1_9HYPO|nr:hypothetical protein EDB81DRAFT_878759 [Dactylonectria macrodidyma]
MVHLTTLFLTLACSALASPFVRQHGERHLERRGIPSLPDANVTILHDVEATVYDRSITKANAKPSFICDATCKACVADTTSKKGRGKLTSRSWAEHKPTLNERTLDDIEDLWGGPGETDDYIMTQINTVAGKGDELDWHLLQHDAVSGQGPWNGKPSRKYIRGLMGCTAVVIVSDMGYWYAHFMETGFLDLHDNWATKIIRPLQQGTAKFTLPRSLASPGGILNKVNNVRIYVSTPRTKTSTERNPVLLYKSKVDELMSHITGRGSPFQGAQVITRGYLKPENDADAALFHNSANGKVLIEYDNDQLDINGNQPNPKEQMYRVWLEHKYFEHRFR